MRINERISNWLKSSEAIVVTTGAGMGIDSGLNDYRGDGGQWGRVKENTKLNAIEVMNPKYLSENPKYVWEIFVQRMHAYHKATPHKGFDILLKWITNFELDYFVLTSNVDEQFIKAGFDENKYRELHGSVFYMQCNKPCSDNVWRYDFDLDKLREEIAEDKYPVCQECGELIRPNVYMFRDNTYLSNRSDEQENRFQDFLSRNKENEIVVFEIGSGPHVQSIRKKTRMLGINYNAHIVRINPKDYKIKEPHIGIGKGALESLEEIDDYIEIVSSY